MSVRLPPGCDTTRFPALAEGSLTVTLRGSLEAATAGGLAFAVPAAVMSGPSTGPTEVLRRGPLHCVGLRLRPGGLQALVSGSPAILVNRTLDPADLWGPAWAACSEQLWAAPDDAARIGHLFAFVRGLVHPDIHRRRASRAWALQAAVLHDCGATLGRSQRQHERVFGATFGLRPKQFQRMVRLEQTLREALVLGRTDAGLALEHGYFDQSHLGRDLRELVGLPLRTLVRGVQEGDIRHWPLLIGARYRQHGIEPTPG